jgi:cellulose biosynthesis protein BcsQ
MPLVRRVPKRGFNNKGFAEVVVAVNVIDLEISFDAGAEYAGRENRIIAVISPEGGCGRTSVAIALCSHYSRLRLRALYINLDFMGVESLAFNCEAGGGLSEIIYTMKSRPERLGIKLEAMGKPSPSHGFFYFAPPLYPMDIDEMQPSDIEVLIAKLRGAGLYDRIVFDTHSGLSLRNKTLVELSDGVFAITTGSEAGKAKLFLMKKQIDRCFGAQAGELYKRFHILVNRLKAGAGNHLHESGANNPFISGVSDEIGGAFSAKVSVLPYCAEIIDDYGYEALGGVSNGFGAAVAEIAHRN